MQDVDAIQTVEQSAVTQKSGRIPQGLKGERLYIRGRPTPLRDARSIAIDLMRRFHVSLDDNPNRFSWHHSPEGIFFPASCHGIIV